MADLIDIPAAPDGRQFSVRAAPSGRWAPSPSWWDLVLALAARLVWRGRWTVRVGRWPTGRALWRERQPGRDQAAARVTVLADAIADGRWRPGDGPPTV